MVFGFLSLNL